MGVTVDINELDSPTAEGLMFLDAEIHRKIEREQRMRSM